MTQKQKSVLWSDFLGFATQMSAGCYAALCLEAPSSWGRGTAACLEVVSPTQACTELF